MSSAKDIWEVYSKEIADKSRLVYRKGGAIPFFNGDDFLRVKSLFQVLDDDKYIKLRAAHRGGRAEGSWEGVSTETGGD